MSLKLHKLQNKKNERKNLRQNSQSRNNKIMKAYYITKIFYMFQKLFKQSLLASIKTIY